MLYRMLQGASGGGGSLNPTATGGAISKNSTVNVTIDLSKRYVLVHGIGTINEPNSFHLNAWYIENGNITQTLNGYGTQATCSISGTTLSIINSNVNWTSNYVLTQLD